MHGAGGSGRRTRLCGWHRGRLPARARSGRDRARRRPADDLLPASPPTPTSSHDREMPRAAETLGADRGELRLVPEPASFPPRRRGRTMTRKTRMCPPARDDCDFRGRHRQRRRHHGAAVHGGARSPRCLRAQARAQHAARSPRRGRNVARVADPTAGNRLEREFDRHAMPRRWALFQEIERAGGGLPRSNGSDPAEGCGGAGGARARAVASRTLALVGANEFPDLAEARVACSTWRRQHRRRCRWRSRSSRCRRCGLPRLRGALREPLTHPGGDRDAAQGVSRQSRQRHRFQRAANFATNFFGAGGIEAVTTNGSRAARR